MSDRDEGVQEPEAQRWPKERWEGWRWNPNYHRFEHWVGPMIDVISGSEAARRLNDLARLTRDAAPSEDDVVQGNCRNCGEFLMLVDGLCPTCQVEFIDQPTEPPAGECLCDSWPDEPSPSCNIWEHRELWWQRRAEETEAALTAERQQREQAEETSEQFLRAAGSSQDIRVYRMWNEAVDSAEALQAKVRELEAELETLRSKAALADVLAAVLHLPVNQKTLSSPGHEVERNWLARYDALTGERED